MPEGRQRIAAILFAVTAVAALAIFMVSGGTGGSGVTARPDRTAADLLDGLIAASSPDDFDRPGGPWDLALPRDHGGHPRAQTETWTITTHLAGATGDRIGVHFSLSRFGIRAPAPVEGGSSWALTALHRAHMTVSKETGGEALSEERYARGSVGVAGHDNAEATMWLDHWSLSFAETARDARLTLSATVDAEPVRLVFRPVKKALQMNAQGTGPVRGYALPRLDVTGTIGSGETRQTVEGVAWLDHLWGDLPVPGGPVAYDRLSAHLDDGTDVSIVRSRRRDGRGTASAEGTLIPADGAARALSADDIGMEPLATWQAGRRGEVYPLAWRIRGGGLDLEVAPVFEDQRHPFAMPIWSGLVEIEGHHGASAVTGTGTLQLTGYAEQ